MQVILPHVSQFSYHEDFNQFTEYIKQAFPKITLIPCRYYGSMSSRCNDVIFAKLCLSSVFLWPNIMLTFKNIDLKQFNPETESQLSIAASQLIDDFDYSANCEDDLRSDLSSEMYIDSLSGYLRDITFKTQSLSESSWSNSSTVEIDVVGSSQSNSQQTLIASQSTVASSRRTIIMSQREIEIEIQRSVHFYNMFKMQRDINIPVSIKGAPIDDVNGNLLGNWSIMKHSYARVIELWNARIATNMFDPITMAQLENGVKWDFSNRFDILIMIEDQIACIIRDNLWDEWAYVNLSPAKGNFEQVLAKIYCYLPELGQHKGFQIETCTQLHPDFPMVHLLFALHGIQDLFSDAQRLPRRLLYTEKQFRNYSWLVCCIVQQLNSSYNLRNSYVDDYGNLKPGAYISYPSPVLFERSVIATDMCPFCGKRNFNNLGRHMSMAHGQQAIRARIARDEKANNQ